MTNLNDLPETPQYPQPGQPIGPGNVSPPTGPLGQPGRETNKDARMWAMFAHLAGLAAIIVPGFGAVIGPLIVWLIKKDEYPFVDEQGKEALNFQITMLIYGIVATLTIPICIGLVLLPAVAIVDLVFLIIASIKVNEGEHYRYPYPFIIRFIK